MESLPSSTVLSPSHDVLLGDISSQCASCVPSAETGPGTVQGLGACTVG